jgi:hypothetical protein
VLEIEAFCEEKKTEYCKARSGVHSTSPFGIDEFILDLVHKDDEWEQDVQHDPDIKISFEDKQTFRYLFATLKRILGRLNSLPHESLLERESIVNPILSLINDIRGTVLEIKTHFEEKLASQLLLDRSREMEAEIRDLRKENEELKQISVKLELRRRLEEICHNELPNGYPKNPTEALQYLVSKEKHHHQYPQRSEWKTEICSDDSKQYDDPRLRSAVAQLYGQLSEEIHNHYAKHSPIVITVSHIGNSRKRLDATRLLFTHYKKLKGEDGTELKFEE